MNHSRVKVNWGFSCIMKSRSNMSPNIYLSRELTWSMHTTLMIRNNEDDVEWLFCWNPLTSLWFIHVCFYLFLSALTPLSMFLTWWCYFTFPHIMSQLHIFLLISFSFLLFLLPSASNMASDQGQVLVIVTAAVGGFTLLVILTLFLLITGR